MSSSGYIYNACVATCDPKVPGAYGRLQNANVVWQDGLIHYVGVEPYTSKGFAGERINAHGRLVTPGFIDCHTHAVYAGDRAQEFERRLRGESYAAIAASGGGIAHTVAATRKASIATLLSLAETRLARLMQSGVTSVEVKSGYGLDYDNEIKILETIQALNGRLPLHVFATCLAAHTLPEGFDGDHDSYIDWVCEGLLPEVKRRNLARAVDVFCESIAFNLDQGRRLFCKARELGFAIKGHVEQLSQSYGTDLICEFNGVSADHLEYLEGSQVQKMKAAGVTAVLLPGAYYFLQESRCPPVALLRQHRVPMAIATDMNPGSSPLFSITSAANMACVQFGLSLDEALLGITRHGAKALGLEQSKGMLKQGMDADVLLWPVDSPANIIYESPSVAPEKIWISGTLYDADVGASRGMS